MIVIFMVEFADKLHFQECEGQVDRNKKIP